MLPKNLIERLTETESRQKLLDKIASTDKNIIFTMNANLLHQFSLSTHIREYYNNSTIILNDSHWFYAIARLFSRHIIKYPGSELISDLINDARFNCIIIGPNKSDAIRDHIILPLPYTNKMTELINSLPDKGFFQNLERLDKKNYYLVCAGAQKQEAVANHLIKIGLSNIICAGASIDFLTGKETRAPKLLRSIGLEWLYRFLQNPVKKFKPAFIYATLGLVKFIRALSNEK